MTEADPAVKLGPPDYKKLARLYCMNGGFHLRLAADGSVAGAREEDAYCEFRRGDAMMMMITRLSAIRQNENNGFNNE